MLKQLVVQFDTSVSKAIQRWPRWLRAPMVALTTVGQPVSLTVLAGGVATVAWQREQYTIIIGITLALTAMMANSVLKHFIHRTRPDTLYVSEMWFATSSFPSGHAFGSTVVLGLLAYVGSVRMESPWDYVLPGSLGLIILGIGLSRIYLGAHFPTDVMAGWLLGVTVLTGIVLGAGL